MTFVFILFKPNVNKCYFASVCINLISQTRFVVGFNSVDA